MGADNLRSFHRWQKWRGIAAMVPIAVVDRLGPSLYATASAAGQALARARIPDAAARSLPDRKPPAWVYLHGLKSPLSSTALRADCGGGHKTDAKAPQLWGCRNSNRLKPLTGRAYLRRAPLRSRAVMQRKERNPWQHLHSPGPARVAPPNTISKVRPDAEEILRLVLARLDDMKAEDTVTIDLTGKTSIADTMVVTSGRSNRQVGAIADRLLEDLAKAGVPEPAGRGPAALRLGADRRR